MNEDDDFSDDKMNEDDDFPSILRIGSGSKIDASLNVTGPGLSSSQDVEWTLHNYVKVSTIQISFILCFVSVLCHNLLCKCMTMTLRSFNLLHTGEARSKKRIKSMIIIRH